MRHWLITITLLMLLPAPLASAVDTASKGDNAYRALRDSVRAGRLKTVEMHARVVSVLGPGRYALDLTVAEFARSGVPSDYPVTLVAGGAHLIARFLSAEQVRIRDNYARENDQNVPITTEVRLVVDDTSSSQSKSAVVLDAWSGALLLPLDLRLGDVVTMTSRAPDPRGP